MKNVIKRVKSVKFLNLKMSNYLTSVKCNGTLTILGILISFNITLLFITVANWDSMGRVITQTRGRAFQTLGRTFSFLLNPQKLGRMFQMLGRAFEKLGRAFQIGSAACFETNARPFDQRTH